MSKSGNKKEFIRLVTKVLRGNATKQEKHFVNSYYQYFEKEQGASSKMASDEKKEVEERILQRLNAEKEAKTKIIPFYKKNSLRAVAAILIIVISGAICFWYFRASERTAANNAFASRLKNDIAPGANKATLILANGHKIQLDSIHTGLLAKQGNSKILNFNNGQLKYKNEKLHAGKVMYNTVSTPRGGQYKLELPDGTKVWLNAESSVTFPTAFSGKDRLIKMTGEAYFEVKHNTQQPFKIQVGHTEVEDLGTHFNVMAYKDEDAVKTTLLEGSVSVARSGKKVVLKPGEQAVVTRDNNEAIKVKKVDVEQAIAWKNGEFYFNSTDIYSIMRQLSRWYNVDVVFKDSLQLYLNGNIKRDVNVSKVFEMLELTGEINFRIDNRNIIVMKKQD